MKNTQKLPKPSIAETPKYLDKRETLENYVQQESALDKLLQLLPENKIIEDILLKVSGINDFYSTNIFSVHSVAKHILAIKNVDERLKNGDVSLVNEIAKITIQDKPKNFYSFATKYCCHHNPIDFVIYDSYVDKVLCYYKKEYKFAEFKKDDLRDYAKFKAVLLQFRAYFGLEQFSLRELDTYLWLLGKEYFQNF